jgi:hypothetical protein
MFFLFNSMRGALGTNTCPADFSKPLLGISKYPKDWHYSTKGMLRGEKIEVLKKIFVLNFI